MFSIRWWRLRARPSLLVALLIAFGLTSLTIFNRNLREGALRLVRPTSFYFTGLTGYNFQPTPEERACLHGTARRINAPGMSLSIPNIAHFAWGLAEPTPAPLILWLAIRAAATNLGSNTKIRLHFVHLNDEGPWWSDIYRRVTLVRHDPDFLDRFDSIKPPPSEWDVAHKTDILRLQILREEGGIWLDSDAIVLRPLKNLLIGRRDVIMVHEGGDRGGMANAVILAKKGAPFLERWYRMYDYFDPSDWNHHSVILPAKLADTYPDEICQLSPAAFFWPLWTDNHVSWMHSPLNATNTLEVEAAMKRTGGALFEEQLIYHAWNHLAQKYVMDLTPERIRAEDTRFNMLVRRFVD